MNNSKAVPLQQGEVYPQKDGQYPPPQQGYPPQQGVPPPQGGYPPQHAPPPYTQAQGGLVYNQQPGSYQQDTIVYTAGVAQPAMMQGPPPNHFGLALVTCLLCFWPISIFALIKSSEVNSAYAAGDMVRAKNASDSARRFSMISIGFGIVSWIGFVIFMIIYFAVVIPSIADRGRWD